MKTLILADGVASSVAIQTAVTLVATPFLAGRDVVARILPQAVTGTPTFLIQGSDDNSAWTTLVTSTSLADKIANIKLMKYMRFNITVAGTGGTVTAVCDNGA